ncbi:FkbM family methyltransferase [Pseudomonadota bacterium]
MSIKRYLRRTAEKLTGTYIFKNPPRGMSVFNDVIVALPNYHTSVVFDVGANVGDSARNYLNYFPTSQIYCFEPISETYRQLEANTKLNPNVHCFNLALGASKRKETLIHSELSTMSRRLNTATTSINSPNMRSEKVDVVTLKDICKTHDINHISYLKVDTEGMDLEVLEGAGVMLSEQRIDLIEVEAGMNPGNSLHVPFEALKSFLERNGYFLFGIYEQLEEWITKEPHLRRTNPVFISKTMIGIHRVN